MRLDTPGVQIQVRIDGDTPIGRFNDCLYFAPAEFSRLTQAQLDVAIVSRVGNWVARVTAQSNAPVMEPTLQELDIEASRLEQEASEAREKWRRKASGQ